MKASLLTFLVVPLLLHRDLLSWIYSSSWRHKFGRKQKNTTWKYTNKLDFYILAVLAAIGPPYWISVHMTFSSETAGEEPSNMGRAGAEQEGPLWDREGSP